VERRLVAHARATRAFIGLSVLLGCVTALLIVAQAWLVADVVAEAFLGGRDLAQLRLPMAALLAVVLGRALVAWTADVTAARASASVKSQLRGGLLRDACGLAARGEELVGTGEVAVLATRGIDALDGYFSAYLPQLFLAVIVPATIVVAVLVEDWVSAAIIAVTVPLIPLFMALVGATTGERTETQLQALERLAGHFLDVVAGLPTLKIFGRARAQAESIARITDAYRKRTLATLRLTFLSSLVLELVATVAVALVAVAIGIRLLDGGMGLRAGLFALVLAPEAYLPLRRLGASYHASAEGMAAAARVFDVSDASVRQDAASAPAPDPASEAIVVEDVEVTHPGRELPALSGVSLRVEPGEMLAVTGPSGCGKSTLLALLLGLRAPARGSVQIGGVEIASLDPGAWHERLAWVPQRPHIFHASVADNVRVGRSDASDGEMLAALEDAGLADVVRALPDGPHTMLGDRGSGLSAGERQRLALARAFLRNTPLLLLDEPTAGLDGETERGLLATVRRLGAGRTVVIVAHRPALVEVCDRVVELTPGVRAS
jgi:thiol reductant ABC exporter CydD subunit